jgi:NADH-quinone oxidoreductase subunit J
VGPAGLSAVLLGELVYMLWQGPAAVPGSAIVTPRDVGVLFFGPYLLAVELASMLLLAGLVGAYHLGRRERGAAERDMENAREERRRREAQG